MAVLYWIIGYVLTMQAFEVKPIGELPRFEQGRAADDEQRHLPLRNSRNTADIAWVLWMWASFWVTTLRPAASARTSRAVLTSSGTSTWAPRLCTVISR